MQIQLVDAIKNLRDELREAIIEGQDKEIVFTPTGIELELGITFTTETKGEAGFKVLALLDLSAEGRVNHESQHKIRLSLAVNDRNGQPIKVRAEKVPGGMRGGPS